MLWDGGDDLLPEPRDVAPFSHIDLLPEFKDVILVSYLDLLPVFKDVVLVSHIVDRCEKTELICRLFFSS